MTDATEETALLTRAQSGDREAFWELASPSVNAIYRLALRMMKSEEDAEDVVQETYLKALGAIGDFRGHSRFTTWLHRIAVNQALMKLRKRRSNVFSMDAMEEGDNAPPLSLVDWSETVLDDLVRMEATGVLEETLQELPIDLKTVVILRDVNGLSNDETAQVLDLPLGAVKWRLHRARTLLRDRLSSYFRERLSAKGGRQA